MNPNNHETGLELAVIGMAARYPGIRNMEEFWEVLSSGRETITFFSDEELARAGEEVELLDNPNYVRARGLLEDVEFFDASFFGYSQWEARLMDPQVRVFHECTWHALEDAGYAPGTTNGLTGIYAGAKSDITWQLKALLAPDEGMVDLMTAILLSSKDHIATRISYALDLRGPSFSFYTACSTSLVAVHLASQALLAGECDMALAGGVTFHLPQQRGYIYDEELIHSRDGHTRSFDAESTGLVDGSGAGVVVLKRLEDARADKDHIYAIIKGTGINNDGSRKIGYTAPSILGQEALLQDVYNAAAIDPGDISFIECHGSATPLGDPVEVEALRRFFPKNLEHPIALGTVKTNFGHCDCAAGIASFIKTVLALNHRQIPPTLHFKHPNPKLDLENSPFYIETKLVEWESKNGNPLRAGVNSLGLGGTNAHVILEEAPDAPEPDRDEIIANPQYYLLPLSAKTQGALALQTENLAKCLEKNRELSLPKVTNTLQSGRKTFAWRRAFVCSDSTDALKQLSQPQSSPLQPILAGEQDRPLVFMYSGQGSEYINMGRNLYEIEQTFRKDIDEAFDYLTGLIHEDLKPVLYPQDEAQLKAAQDKIHRFYYTQPVKFIFEYAYTRLLMHKGLQPHALMGYSFGEYMVACVAGVISLEDALAVLMKRGEIMAKAPAGAMIGVALSAVELETLLKPGLYIGGINSGRMCLVSGEAEAVEAFEKDLENKNIDFFRYRAACGGHSPLMDPILPELGRELEKISFHKPRIPYVSGLSGTWITDEDALDPYYFTRQLRSPVLFAQALETLFKNPGTIFLEVGPGTTLANYVKFYKENGQQPDIQALPMVRHHKDDVDDNYFLLNRLAQLWCLGKNLSWETFYPNEKPGRCPLPGYPFEKQYYWIDFDPLKGVAPGTGPTFTAEPGKPGKVPVVRNAIQDWYYIPSWRSTLQLQNNLSMASNFPETDPVSPLVAAGREKPPWLVFMDPENRGQALVERILSDDWSITIVEAAPRGESFQQTGTHRYLIDPAEEGHYLELFRCLREAGTEPVTIIHLWNLESKPSVVSQAKWDEQVLETGYFSLLSIARAIGRQEINISIQLEVVTTGMQSVAGEAIDTPVKAALLGPIKIIPQEYPNIKCRSLDVVWPQSGTPAEKLLISQLYKEILTPQTKDQELAIRGDQRQVKYYQPAPLESVSSPHPAFKEGGVYLIVGGLGGVGLILGRYLAQNYNARLVLTSRTGLPNREQWPGILEKHKEETSRQTTAIRAIQEMEKEGGEVMVMAAHVADETAMTEVVKQARQKSGPINGIIHCGYVADGTVIHQRTRETCQKVLAPKIKGTLVLDRVTRQLESLDFFILCSSLAGIFGPIGQVAYTAGSAFQDAFARYRSIQSPFAAHYISIDWGDWAGTASLEDSVRNLAGRLGIDPQVQLKDAMKPSEGIEAFNRVMATNASQVLVSARELSFLLGHLNSYAAAPLLQEHSPQTQSPGSKTLLPRPPLKTPFVAPRNQTEKAIASIWQNLFSLETIGVDDDFFQLGGDSLKAMTASSKIHKELNIKIPIAKFFSSPTVSELSRFLEKQGKKKPQPLEKRAGIPLTEKKEHYPLSAMQQRLYHFYEKSPQGTRYNVTLPFLLEGPLQREKLETILRKLVHRHEIFRTSFHLIGKEPRQKVHPEADLHMEYREIEAENVDRVLVSLEKPFELEAPPLLRAILIAVSRERHILVIETHHIAIDGTSFEIFRQEFLFLYRQQELPGVKITVKDYCQWQYKRFREGDIKALEAYWRQQFREPVPALEIPKEFFGTDGNEAEGRAIWCDIDANMTQKIRKFAQRTGTTTFMVFLAAYGMLLHRWTGKSDMVIGLRTANRGNADLERVMGRLSNELGIRLQPSGDISFQEFLLQVKDRALELFRHQEYPFDRLIEQLDYSWPADRPSLFETMVVYNNMENQAFGVEVGNLKFGAYGLKRVKVLYDIFLQATEVGDVVHLLVHYPEALFKPETMERMLIELLEILHWVTVNPEVPLRTG